MKNFKYKFLSIVTIFTVILTTSGFVNILTARAASLTSMYDTMSRLKVSLPATNTIVFRSPSAIHTNGNTITIDFPTGFDFTGSVVGDLTVKISASTTFTTSETLVAGAPGTTTWGTAFSDGSCSTNQKCRLVLTAPTSGVGAVDFIANDYMQITYASTHELNPASTGLKIISITTPADAGSFAVAIVDDDQVSVTASVGVSLTFDIDTSTTNSSTSNPYSVALGPLTTVNGSNSDGSTINSIWISLTTSSSAGATVTVKSANAALKSTAVSTDSIPSATGTITPGVANYGLCVLSVTQASGGTLTASSPFASSPCTHGHVDAVGGVTTSTQNILSVGSPMSSGRSEIVVAAENNAVTPAHNDYGDTLTFLATATF